AWPDSGGAGDNSVTVKALGTGTGLYQRQIEKVELVGNKSSEPLQWNRGEDGLHVYLPAERPCDHAFALKITHQA
ncbi:MAG TPA: alpha-L-fucosidase C-terminal domain-containing protein, partial [Chloroflexota bacterium]|nr:alpha-L-fucosidase C-terminal domain-containing protein [Chloroflexota bacterium]